MADPQQKKASRVVDIVTKTQAEKAALAFVERLTSKEIPENLFVKMINHITADHYGDVTEERALISLCGYPLCSNTLRPLSKKMSQQKYSIRNNRVYEIGDRNNFCCSHCYACSNHVKTQIPTSPLWMRNKHSLKSIQLLPKTATVKLTPGDEIMLEHRIKEEDIDQVGSLPPEDEDECESLNFDYDAAPSSIQKKTENHRKLIFIDELMPAPRSISRKVTGSKCGSSFHSCIQLLCQWCTDDTKMFLHGGKKAAGSNNEKKLGNEKDVKTRESEKLMALEEKMNSLILGTKSSKKANIMKKPLPDINDLSSDGKGVYQNKVEQFFFGKTITDTNDEKQAEHNVTEEVVLPTVDSENQMEIRRKVLNQAILGRMKNLCGKDLDFPSISRLVRCLVATFRLTSKNVMLRGRQADGLSLIAVYLLKGMNQNVEQFYASEKYQTRLEEFSIDRQEIRNQIERVLNRKNKIQ